MKTNEYSEKELALFKYWGLDYLVDHLLASEIYRLLAEKAFLSRKEGKEVESVRRCVDAFQKSKIYRLTPEWDEMIEI